MNIFLSKSNYVVILNILEATTLQLKDLNIFDTDSLNEPKLCCHFKLCIVNLKCCSSQCYSHIHHELCPEQVHELSHEYNS